MTLHLRGGFGADPSDLAARNIIRGRDHGLPGYNHYRKVCGLPRACSWSSPPAEISAADWQTLSTLYNHPNDIDLMVAGLAERPAFGGVVGKTFNCLIRRQFLRLKYGDRYGSRRDNLGNYILHRAPEWHFLASELGITNNH